MKKNWILELRLEHDLSPMCAAKGLGMTLRQYRRLEKLSHGCKIADLNALARFYALSPNRIVELLREPGE